MIVDYLVYCSEGTKSYVADPRMGKQVTPSKRLARRFTFQDAMAECAKRNPDWRIPVTSKEWKPNTWYFETVKRGG